MCEQVLRWRTIPAVQGDTPTTSGAAALTFRNRRRRLFSKGKNRGQTISSHHTFQTSSFLRPTPRLGGRERSPRVSQDQQGPGVRPYSQTSSPSLRASSSYSKIIVPTCAGSEMSAATSNGHPDNRDLSDLSRTTTGLSDAHRELILMLAEISVEQFLRECAPPPGAPQ